jgi:hypothetical protein
MVPPTSVMTQEATKNRPGIMGQPARLDRHGDAVALNERQRHRAVAGVLVQLLAALLALFLQLLQGVHRGQKLHDDRGEI